MIHHNLGHSNMYIVYVIAILCKDKHDIYVDEILMQSALGSAQCSNSLKRGGQKYFQTFPEQLSIISYNFMLK